MFPTNCPYPTAFSGTSWNAHQTSLMECQHEDLRAARSAHVLTPSPGADSSRESLGNSEIPTHGAVIQCTKTLAHEDTGPRLHAAALTSSLFYIFGHNLYHGVHLRTHTLPVYLCIIVYDVYVYNYVCCYYVYSPSTCICHSPSKSFVTQV